MENETIDEISIDSNLNWKPVTLASTSSAIEQNYRKVSNVHDITLDDEMDEKYSHHPIDCKANIQLLPSAARELSDVILIDD